MNADRFAMFAPSGDCQPFVRRARRVLVVVDDPARTNQLAEALRWEGYSVEVAALSPRVARALCSGGSVEDYDVIVSDARLPGIGGGAGVHRAFGAPVVLLSSFTAPGKPVDAARLLAVLRDVAPARHGASAARRNQGHSLRS